MDDHEQQLRDALEARSGNLDPAFRERVSASLAASGAARAPIPAVAIAAMALLVVAAVGGLVLSRHLLGSGPVGRRHVVVTASPSPSPSPEASPEASPIPTPAPSPSGQAVMYPTGVELSPDPDGVLWAYLPGVNRLYRSTDGGATWQQRTVPVPGDMLPQQPEVSFVDAAHGWMLVPAEPGSQCGQEAAPQLYRTSDGGATWQQLQLQGIDDRQCKNELSFVDQSRGFISAFDQNSAPRIFRTTDGGLTWQASAALADPPGFHSGGGGFQLGAGKVRALGSTLLVPAGGRSTDGTDHSYVFHSLDGGATWSYLATVPQDQAPAFVSTTHWFAGGMSIETADSGATWHASGSSYTQAAPVAPEVIFVDANDGYAVVTTRGEIQRTADGGLHWTAIKSPGM